MSAFHQFLRDQARRKHILAASPVSPVAPGRSPKAAESLTEDQITQLRDARVRVEAALARPDLSTDNLRARARAAARWEQDQGEVFAFSGTR